MPGGALYAPAKTPKEIIDRFRTALIESLREDKAARMLTESQQMTPAADASGRAAQIRA